MSQPPCLPLSKGSGHRSTSIAWSVGGGEDIPAGRKGLLASCEPEGNGALLTTACVDFRQVCPVSGEETEAQRVTWTSCCANPRVRNLVTSLHHQGRSLVQHFISWRQHDIHRVFLMNEFNGVRQNASLSPGLHTHTLAENFEAIVPSPGSRESVLVLLGY